MDVEVDKIYNENCLDTLGRMPDELLDCVVTSPPYWALRDYGKETETVWDNVNGCLHEWGETTDYADYADKRNQFCKKCGAWRGALGLEPSFELYIKHLCDIFDGVKRVLKRSGTIWVNIGDTYGGSGNASGHTESTKNLGYTTLEMGATKGHTQKLMPKSLIMIPFRFAIEMVERGWILRNTIIWHKPNCMPSSVKDRFTVDFEYLFFFVKSRKYWFEQQFEASHFPIVWSRKGSGENTPYQLNNPRARWGKTRKEYKKNSDDQFALRNKRTVWEMPIPADQRFESFQCWLADIISEINPELYGEYRKKYIELRELADETSALWKLPTRPFPGAHFAVFPEQLIETPIKAGCPEFICEKCGKAREKVYKKTGNLIGMGGHGSKTADHVGVSPTSSLLTKKVQEKEMIGYSDCGCGAGFRSGIVYDPFMGAGTTAVVAKKLGRHFIGSEMNGDYVEMAEGRVGDIKENRQLEISNF